MRRAAQEIKDLKKGVLEEPSPFSALLCAFEGCLCRQHQERKGCRSQMVSLSLACKEWCSPFPSLTLGNCITGFPTFCSHLCEAPPYLDF